MASADSGFRPHATELLIPWIVLGIILTYVLGLLYRVPYAGFEFHGGGRGVVSAVFVDNPGEADLMVGDRIVQVGPTTWADYSANWFLTLFDGVRPGDRVPITVERDGRLVTILWMIPGRSSAEWMYRVQSEWVVSPLFWGAGTAVLLIVRPRDRRRNLLAAFNFLTAVWLACGSLGSHWHLLGSPLVLRAAVWLSAPVTIHLHWLFPRPFGRVPARVWLAGYAIAAALIAAEVFRFLPLGAYQVGFGLAAFASLVLLLVRAFIRPQERREVLLVAAGVAVALLPAAVVAYLRPAYAGAALFMLPALPGAYLYVAARGRLGGFEIRANRVIAGYLFVILAGAAFVLLLPAATGPIGLPAGSAGVGVVASILGLLVGVLGFAPFQRWVETRLLGARVTQADLVRTLMQRITSRLDVPDLTDLLRQTVLPSLYVREAALFSLDDNGQVEPVATINVKADQLPTAGDLPALLEQAGRYRPPVSEAAPAPCPWARVALPLRFDDKPIGLWLLGRLDPDDYYSHAEIANLQLLADQIALALAHIRQTERLRTFFQANADRYEAERSQLARELHDRLLNGLVALRMRPDGLPAPLYDAVTELIGQFHQIIRGLRLTTLAFGLPTALEALADDLQERAPAGPTILLEVSAGDGAYPPEVGLYIFRIVEQAAENVLRHAQAKTLRISGLLEPGRIALAVEDDGKGFALDGGQMPYQFLARGYYGLAGIVERATLIRADLDITSTPGRGTRVQVVWQPDDASRISR